MTQQAEIIINEVRLSFPQLITPGAYTDPEGKTRPTYGAKVLLHPEENAEGLAKLQAWQQQLSGELPRPPSDDMCALRPGEWYYKRPEYAPYWVLSANARGPVKVFSPGMTVLTTDTQDDGVFSGMRAHVKVQMYAHKTSGRVNCQLVAVQVSATLGEAMTASVVTTERAMEGFTAQSAEDMSFLGQQ